MSTLAGLLFLFGGVAVFVLCVALLALAEKRGRKPRNTVEGFRRSRHALHKIHRTQTTLKESSRARARAMHPAGRRPRNRRSA